ncbi:MAG: sigma-70 family RNA polymerase sigma factor [Acidimicrobiales bacterium]|nr:sigma-70 family RNA polymerase sigma factor [Acidimicrobiales bacterium]
MYERTLQVVLLQVETSGTALNNYCDGDVDIIRDKALVERFQGGDHDAFDELYSIYKRRVLRFCKSRLGDVDDAQDATQETFVRAWRSLKNLDGEKRFYPWLSVIASHICTDVLRARSRNEARENNIDFAASESDPSDHVVRSQNQEFVHVALGRLSDRHQRVLKMREVNEWTYEEIADAEGVRISTVESLLFRARQALKREIQFVVGPEGRGGFAVILIPLLRKLQEGMAKLNAKRITLDSGGGRILRAVTPVGSVVLCATIVLASNLGSMPSKSTPSPVLHSSKHVVNAGSASLSGLNKGTSSPLSNQPVPTKYPSGSSASPAANGTGLMPSVTLPNAPLNSNISTVLSPPLSAINQIIGTLPIQGISGAANTTVSTGLSSATSVVNSTYSQVSNTPTIQQATSSTLP